MRVLALCANQKRHVALGDINGLLRLVRRQVVARFVVGLEDGLTADPDIHVAVGNAGEHEFSARRYERTGGVKVRLRPSAHGRRQIQAAIFAQDVRCFSRQQAAAGVHAPRAVSAGGRRVRSVVPDRCRPSVPKRRRDVVLHRKRNRQTFCFAPRRRRLQQRRGDGCNHQTRSHTHIAFARSTAVGTVIG